MQYRVTRSLTGLVAAVCLAVQVLSFATPAQAADTLPCDSAGTTSADAELATRLNQELVGGMRGAMTAYRVSCARVVAAVIRGRGLPVRAAHIAITTTIVESTIRNLTYGDRDSLGLYQQRPSQGWGTEAQILDPVYATNRFINKMLQFDWRNDPIGKICQQVQVSAFPDRYYAATADGIDIADAVWTLSSPEPEPYGDSVTGDVYTDLLTTKADGTLWLFANNFVRDGGQPYGSTGTQIGSGWGNYARLIPADATGDGYTDLVGIKTDGTTILFSNNIVRDGGIPYKDYRPLAINLAAYNRVIGADATGDGYTDLVATKTDGTTWLFSNNIVRDGGEPYSTPRQLTPNLSTHNRVL